MVAGVSGALAFELPTGANLMNVHTAYFMEYGSPTMKGIVDFLTLSFPILCLITSIPVAMIIIRLNLIMSRMCSKDWATFWGSILPFLICLPFQTGHFMITFTNWSSLFFQSMCNFMAPFLIYIFLDKRNMVMAQSVIDDLEFLDLDGAIKQKSNDDDDDFDYVYHLPHADLSRLPPRTYDPFSQFAIVETTKKQINLERRKNIPTIGTAVSGSMASVQGKAVAKLLNLGTDARPDPRLKRMQNNHKGSKERLAASTMGSQALLGSHLNLSSNGGSNRASTFRNSTVLRDPELSPRTSPSRIGSARPQSGLARRSDASRRVEPEISEMGDSLPSVDFAATA
ncbi:UNVERIFIED_CONTAM: hypothetical protein HDU68_006638, partial [Siphonaria sp. JEL0065]